MTLDRRSQRHRAFTLVELLTVISIISLLIAILLPSLQRVRQQAKRTKSQAFMRVVETGLELFHHDFGYYPSSAEGPDALWLSSPNGVFLSRKMMGANWLARALGGFDTGGIDRGAVMLRWFPEDPATLKLFPKDFQAPGGRYAERRGAYVDSRVFASDGEFNNSVDDARLMIPDDFGSAILYYRASPKSRAPFSLCGIGTKPPGSDPEDSPGVYNQSDNSVFTGGYTAMTFNGYTASDPQATTGKDFAKTGFKHGLGYFPKDPENPHEKPPPDYKGKNFVDYLHDESVHGSSGFVTPTNPESFILVSAGSDGLYGTEDDVTNIKSR